MMKYAITTLLLVGAATAADPCDEVMANTKCTYKGNARVWKKTKLSLQECQAACEADGLCKYYSHQEVGDHAGDCMACTGNGDTDTDPGDNFSMYPVACKNWDSGEEVAQGADGVVTADFGDCPSMFKDYKCPYQHEDRTYRKEGLTIEECYDACVIDPRCAHWSYSRTGDANGNFAHVCMGCNATEHKQVHEGFNLYSMCEDGRKIALERRSASLAGLNNDGSTGGGYGDPHLKTWTGETYDYHGECDMVLVKDTDFANNLGFNLHIRTTIRRDWSFISEAAIKIGQDILEVRGRGEFSFNGIENKLPEFVGGYPVTMKDHSSGKKKRFQFKVDLGEKGLVEIKVFNEFLAAYVENAHEGEFGNSVGLMGRFHDGVKLGRDGVTEITDTNAFGQEWQVQQGEPLLFSTLKGPQFPVKCRMPDPVQKASLRKRRLEETGLTWEEAEAACASWSEESRESCIYDVLSTGELEMASAGAF